MSTFEYVDIPAEATRLVSSPEDLLNHSVRPADKILTSFPDATIRHFPFIVASPLSNPATASSPSKSALSIIPQLLLSSSIPTSAASITLNASGSVFGTTSTPNAGQTSHTYLSTGDPLSLSTMTTNFRRFVARVGPLFWLQDRIEEIILWKKGWKRTVVWLAAYGFMCEHLPLPVYLTLNRRRIRLFPEVDIAPSTRAVVGHNATIPPRTRFAPCSDFRERRNIRLASEYPGYTKSDGSLVSSTSMSSAYFALMLSFL